MPNNLTVSRGRMVTAITVAILGIATGVGLSMKASDYYDPHNFAFDLEEPQSSFELGAGRYELSYKEELGELEFHIASMTGEQVTVEPFGWLTRLFHTSGWRGHVFRIQRPDKYRFDVKPWPTGAEVHLSTTNTAAIAGWGASGILLSGLTCALAASLLLWGRRNRPVHSGEGT